MSQCYRVQLQESISRRVDGSDSISYPIELTEILPADEMKDILRGVLTEAGWEADKDNPDQFTITGTEGEIITIDLEEMEVTAELTDEKEVSTEVTAGARSGRSQGHAEHLAKSELQQKAEAAGDSIEESARRELRQQLRDKLAKSEDERMRTLNEVLQRVYAESLKRKAGQLGDIMEVQESTDDDNYELVIRVSQ